MQPNSHTRHNLAEEYWEAIRLLGALADMSSMGRSFDLAKLSADAERLLIRIGVRSERRKLMDYELRQTQYHHPEITSGQHTNGPANIFVRRDKESPWYRVDNTRALSQVRRFIVQEGFDRFTQSHCVPVSREVEDGK